MSKDVRTTSDFDDMNFGEFEEFAVNVISLYYKPQGIEIVRTPNIGDGGKDGEGSLQLGSRELDGKLQIPIKVWVEAKHHKRNIGRSVVGGHVFAALIGSVNKIVFVSSKDFSPTLMTELIELASRCRLHSTLINGNELVYLHHQINGNETPLVESPQKLDSNAKESRSIGNDAEVLSFNFSSIQKKSSAKKLWLQQGIPVFLHLAIKIHLQASPRSIDVKLFDLKKRDREPLTSIGNSKLIGAGPIEILEMIFCANDYEPGDYSSSQFLVEGHCTDTGELVFATNISEGTESNMLSIEIPFIRFNITETQREALRNCHHVLSKWELNHKFSAFLIESIAGNGKSEVVNLARKSWLGLGYNEIFFDGESQGSLGSIFETLLSYLIPIGKGIFKDSHMPEILSWLEEIGAEKQEAKEFYAYIRDEYEGKNRFSNSIIHKLFALILAQLTAERPHVVIYEDLHKANIDVLKLFANIAGLLTATNSSARVLMCFTSRYSPRDGDEESRDLWIAEREALLSTEEVVKISLPPMNRRQSKEFLLSYLPNLDDMWAETIIEVVGTTPHYLTETLRYFVAMKIVHYDKTVESFDIKDYELLPQVYENLSLTNVSEIRLTAFKKKIANWSKTFIDLASCLGKEFNLERCLECIEPGTVDDQALDDFLGLCMEEDILLPNSGTTVSNWSFSHDLLFEAQLRLLSSPKNHARHRRLSKQLLESCGDTVPSAIRLSLIYQTESGNEFVREGLEHATGLLKRSYFAEASELLRQVDRVIEGDPRPNLGNRFQTNPTYAICSPPAYSRPANWRRHDETRFDVKQMYYEATSGVSSGSDVEVESIITQATMIARRLHDDARLNQVGYWEGNMHIQRGNDSKALDIFNKLTESIDFEKPSGNNSDTVKIMLGLAISQRLVGHKAESANTLESALKLDPDNPVTQIRVNANAGAIHFYDSRKSRRQYWTKAFVVADKNDLIEHKIHMQLDLASIDILDGEFSDAKNRLHEAIDKCREMGFENSLMRGLIMLSSVDLIERNYNVALDRLDHAIRIGYAHSIRRRLWKVHANRATAFEMLGLLDNSCKEDFNVRKNLPELSAEKRVSICLGNIALRANAHDNHKTFFGTLSEELQSIGTKRAEQSLEPSESSLFPYEHVKKVGGQNRYIMT